MKESGFMEKIKPMLFTSLKGYKGKDFAKDVIAGIIVAIIAVIVVDAIVFTRLPVLIIC